MFVLDEVFTKWVTLYPVKRANTTTIVNRLSKNYLPEVGTPQRLLCDHGTQFTSHRWRACLEDLGIQLIFSSVRHPQGNPAERVLRELNRLLRTFRHTNHKGWARDVPKFARLINNVVHESTGYAPCELR